MTEQEFRLSSERRAELLGLLETPAFQAAREVILGKLMCFDAQEGAPEVVSVRLLSHRTGYEMAFADLAKLTLPLPPAPEEPMSDFGEAEAARQLQQED